MKATQILKDEHRVIEQVLECLERLADKSLADHTLDGQSAREAVEFLRMFADRCHHGKEESRLFPMLEEKGFPRENGPTGVMRREHDEGRPHVRGMATEIDSAAAGNADAIERFVQHARAFFRLLRNHIKKEDTCLFPMADQALSDDDQQLLLQEFQQVETHDMGAGVHEKYLETAHRLAERLGVPQTATANEAASVSCCHHATPAR